MQLGYGSRVWGTGRVTTCPPGPGGATQRSSVAGIVSGQDELHQSGSQGEEDVTRSLWSCLSYGVDVCGYLLTECREH